MTLNLLDFIRTGQLGPIACGMTCAEAIDFLGRDFQQSGLGAGTSQLFYNGFEIFYYDDSQRIFGIQHDFIPALLQECPYPISAQTSMDTSFLPNLPSYAALRRSLQAQQIQFAEIEHSDYMELVIDGGTKLDFDQDGLLNGIRIFEF